MEIDIKEMFTLTQASKLCGINRVTLWRWIKSGTLNGYQNPTGQYRILRDDFERFIESELKYITINKRADQNRILIIDDDPSIRKLIKRFLQRKGCQIEEAENGFEVGFKVLNFKPSLMVLDLCMPGIDGFEICRQIKSNPHTEAIKILVITGAGSQEVERKVKELGADGYLEKPLHRDEFLRYIHSLIS